MTGWEIPEEEEELVVPVVAAVRVVPAVVVLIWEVNEEVRSRPGPAFVLVLLLLLLLVVGGLIRLEEGDGDDGDGDILIVECEAGADDDMAPMGKVKAGDLEGRVVHVKPDRLFAPTLDGKGSGGADANLSRRWKDLSLSFCGNEEPMVVVDVPLKVCRIRVGVLGLLRLLLLLEVERVGMNKGNEVDGGGVTKVGVTDESIEICDCEGMDLR